MEYAVAKDGVVCVAGDVQDFRLGMPSQHGFRKGSAADMGHDDIGQ
jgi:hypothetical protein